MQYKSAEKGRIKVCYVITKGNWGGAQKYVYTLATSLPKNQYEVVVVTGEGQALREKLEEKEIRVYTLENLRRDISITREIKSFFAVLKIVWKEKPDVIHLNSPKAAGFGSVAGRLCGTRKIIQTVHGWTFNEDRGALNNILVTFFSWLTVILCHRTIVLAEREKRQVETMPLVRDRKIVLIRNGVEKILFKEKVAARKEILSIIGKMDIGSILWLGTISELHKNKGLEYAIISVSKLTKPFVFFIFGEGEERKNLESLIRQNGLEDKVFLLGFSPIASEYLKAFDIFMLTSIKEGLPYSILESGLAGLPTIASSVGGIPEIIESGVSGILTTRGRSGEITRAIEYMIDKPDERKEFGKKLKQKIEKEFSLEQMLDKTLELYK